MAYSDYLSLNPTTSILGHNRKAIARRKPIDNYASGLHIASMKTDFENRLREFLEADSSFCNMLQALTSLGLADGWLAAGLIRNRLWDHLHGYDEPTALNDIDVIYFDADDLSKKTEKALEAALRDRQPGCPWSVKNQARMAIRNGDQAYRSSVHAMTFWCETPTAIAVRRSAEGAIEIAAPFGLDDLFGLIVRPTPFASANPHKLAQYHKRMKQKNWSRPWPRLRVLSY